MSALCNAVGQAADTRVFPAETSGKSKGGSWTDRFGFPVFPDELSCDGRYQRHRGFSADE